MADPFTPRAPIAALTDALDQGHTMSRGLLETALDRANVRPVKGKVFVKSLADTARGEADASDALRKADVPPRPLEGLPISVKDLFDIKGQVIAGSRVAEVDPPAAADAPAIARLRAGRSSSTGPT